MFGKGKVEKELALLHDLACDCECRLELVNGETRETMVPDPAAVKAGFIAGLVAAESILSGSVADAGPVSRMTAAMAVAGRTYLEEVLTCREERCEVQHG